MMPDENVGYFTFLGKSHKHSINILLGDLEAQLTIHQTCVVLKAVPEQLPRDEKRRYVESCPGWMIFSLENALGAGFSQSDSWSLCSIV